MDYENMRKSVEPHELAKRGILVEVEHVKAHRTKKEKAKLTQFERFVTEGNKKASESAKAGAMMDEGFMGEATAQTMKQEREEVYVALQCAAGFHCLVEEWKDCEEIKRKEKCSFFWTGRVRERSIEQSGARKQIGIDE